MCEAKTFRTGHKVRTFVIKPVIHFPLDHEDADRIENLDISEELYCYVRVVKVRIRTAYVTVPIKKKRTGRKIFG